MNYAVTSIRIPSRWFDIPDRKKNTFQKMEGHKGFNLYLQLYKFRIHNQENEHTFATSISMLRKETGYSAEEIFNLLKRLKDTAKVIKKIEGVSRWEYLLNENGDIKEDKLLLITLNHEECFPIYSQFNKTLDELYIYVSFSLLDKYLSSGLDIRHFALHCLVQRFQKGKTSVCYMAIETMAATLDIDKDTINRMIFNMNRHYLMVSWRKSNEKKRGSGSYRYEHITIEDNNKYADKEKGISHWDGWLFRYKEDMDRMAARADRRAEGKRKQREKKGAKKRLVKQKDESHLNKESDMTREKRRHTFGNKRKPVVVDESLPMEAYEEKHFGEPDPFEDDLSNLTDIC